MIVQYKGENIASLTDWKEKVFVGKKAKHWDKGRSAYSLADFVMNKNGIKKINEYVDTVIGAKAIFEIAEPEYQVRFDRYGQGREHDLALWGKTSKGKSLFVSVEAKVDESFNGTVLDAYIKAKAKELNGERTNALNRIERLLQQHFLKISKNDFNLRYQLFYATAGTLCVKADMHVLLILVFKTDSYKKDKGRLNKLDFQKFIKRIDAIEIEKDTYKVTIQNQELNIVYKEIGY